MLSNILGKKSKEEIEKEIEKIKEQNNERDLILIKKFQQVENTITTLITNLAFDINTKLKELVEKKVKELFTNFEDAEDKFNQTINNDTDLINNNFLNFKQQLEDTKEEIEEIKNKAVKVNEVNNELEQKITNLVGEIGSKKKTITKLRNKIIILEKENKLFLEKENK